MHVPHLRTVAGMRQAKKRCSWWTTLTRGLDLSSTRLFVRTGILVVSVFAVLSFYLAVQCHFALANWERIGGTFRGRDFNLFFGPAEVSLASDAETKVLVTVEQLRVALRRLRNLPNCRGLRLHDLEIEETELNSLLTEFRPEHLSVKNMRFSDSSIESILEIKTVQTLGIADCPVTVSGIQRLLSESDVKCVSIDVSTISTSDKRKLKIIYGDRILGAR